MVCDINISIDLAICILIQTQKYTNKIVATNSEVGS